MTLVAKPIILDKRWIVLDSGHKVGAVEATNNGYRVQLGNNEQCYDSTSKIESFVKIKFERTYTERSDIISYYKWPTTGKTYNNIVDVKRKIHLYTKSAGSKCYYASGWYRVNINGEWQTWFCPKYIYITRYEYRGPYMTPEEASSA